jgi:hypothetical protein
MYLFVKPLSDITTNGEIMISISIVAINIVFFFYAAYLLYQSFKEYAIEKFYTVGQTDAEAARVKARLDAMTEQERAMIAKVEERRRSIAEEKQSRRRSSLGGNGGAEKSKDARTLELTHEEKSAESGDVEMTSLAPTDSASPPPIRARQRIPSLFIESQTGADIIEQLQSSSDLKVESHRPATVVRVSDTVTVEPMAPDEDEDDDEPAQVVNTEHSRARSLQQQGDAPATVESLIDTAKPLDLVAFVQRRAGANAATDPLRWTHVGVIVDSSMLDIVNGRAGELYVLEALRDTGGDDEPCNVEAGTPAAGVQIRSLREVHIASFRILNFVLSISARG